MVYGCNHRTKRLFPRCLYYFADSKTLKEEKRKELIDNLKADESLGWAVNVIDPKELSAKMLKKTKINLNEISHESAMSLIRRVTEMGVLLTEVYVDTVGDPEKYRVRLIERFTFIKFIVPKKADSLYPVVSGASIVAKFTRDRALRNWKLDETADNMNRNFGEVQPLDPATKTWLGDHKHPVFGFPKLVRFIWVTCTPFFKNMIEKVMESDEMEDDDSTNNNRKKQLKLTSVDFTGLKKTTKTEETESSGKGRCKCFQAQKLQQVSQL
ncbi:ribonuclease H2 subunit A-like [Impatiens glandulifera]|uniref:ribonuclease H2 subunit A-like n=1 Tax=Impatiens glandulifera TaxID=253017 RepID=UPI001FB04F1D|nr:ribonuclease H2 subunit A-like [Impatiens glandulifera]